ncbi:magnesium transporter [Sneathiella limimaris]|uniref:magnesium transporter n=1 Tax=Sneathiella limimaris TaxID=1964213 RepID=UPI00146D35F3|nr:magnesium transporter [Sneathiella limimaris]
MVETQEKEELKEEVAVEREDETVTYGLVDETVQLVREFIDQEDVEAVRDQITGLHSADIADLIEYLKPKHRTQLIEFADDLIDADVYTDLDEQVREELVEDMNASEIAEIVNDLEVDDAIEVLQDLEEEDQQEVLKGLAAEDRLVIEEGLGYGEDTAGRLMQRGFIAVPEYWDIGQTIDYMRDTDDLPTDFYEVYVVDPRHHPIGTIPLDHAMRSRRHVAVTDIMRREQTLIPVDMDQEEVAYLFKQYRLSSAAVVNDNGALIGMITVDDVMDVISEEAEEDILRLGGVGEDDLFGSILDTTRTRFTWLLVNLFTAILASVVISFFDATLERVIALAVLMPIVASMGGNAGTQTLTVAVRAIATKELTVSNMHRILGKEALVAFLNGCVFAVLIGLTSWFWFSDYTIGWVIAVAMVVNMLVAGISGMAIPITLDRYNIDPAVASSVFVTTITDVIGFVAFLGIASLVLI